MTPRTLAEHLVRDVPVLHRGTLLRQALRELLDTRLPALPVVDPDDRFVGIFGEREFIAAILPGYLGEPRYAGFVPRSLDLDIEHRPQCLADPVEHHMNKERIDVALGYSDAQLAETFLHHRVLVAPVVDDRRRVQGIVTRSDFFAALAGRALR